MRAQAVTVVLASAPPLWRQSPKTRSRGSSTSGRRLFPGRRERPVSRVGLLAGLFLAVVARSAALRLGSGLDSEAVAGSAGEASGGATGGGACTS